MQQMVQQDNMNQEMSAMGTAMHHCCDLVVPLLNVFTDIGIHCTVVSVSVVRV